MDLEKIRKKLEFADFYRIMSEEIYDENVVIQDGTIKDANVTKLTRASIFAVKNKKAFFFATNNSKDLEAFEFSKMLKVSFPLVFEPKESEIRDKKKIGRQTKECVAEFANEIKDQTKLGGYLKKIRFNMRQTIKKRTIIGRNTEIEQNFNYFIGVASATAKKNSRIGNHHEVVGKTDAFDFYKDKMFEIVNVAKKKGVERLEYKTSLKGNFDVILDPDLAALLSHEAIGHAAEADHIYENESVLKTQLGKKIGTEIVTLIDWPLYKEHNFGFFYYDDEGFVAKKKILMENGILKDQIFDQKYAFLNGRETNGGARAQNPFFMPIPRMSNTYFEPKDWKKEEMIQEIKNGVLLIGGSGGQTNPASGFFQFGVKEAHVIKNGEVKEKYANLSFSGNILEILKNVVAISKEVGDGSPGFCGKNNQRVPVDGTNPYVMVKNVRLG